MEKYTGKERRNYVRVDSNIIIKIQEMSSNEYANKSVAKDISEGGILFEYYKQYPLGTVLCLELRLPEISKRVVWNGKVARLEKLEEDGLYDVGICFINVDSDDIECLNKYIER